MINAKLTDLVPGPEWPEIVKMVVEIPNHSSNKYEYDRELGLFRLDRTLYSPMHYPGEYGFISGTQAEDGDPLDVLTLADSPSFPGIVIAARPVGVLGMVDQGTLDEKILAVPHCNPRFGQMHDIEDVFLHVRKEIEHFFRIYKELEGKKTEVKGWSGRGRAHELIQKARERYVSLQKK